MSQLIADVVRRRVLAAMAGAAMVGYMPSGMAAVATDAQTVMRRSVHLFDYLTVEQQIVAVTRLGTLNLTVPITQAINDVLLTGAKLTVPAGRYIFDGITRTNTLFNIEIEGDAANWPVFEASQAAVDAGTVRLFRFEPDATLDVRGFALAAPVKANQRKVTLDTVAGLEVGMGFRFHRQNFGITIHEVKTQKANCTSSPRLIR